MWTSFIRDDLHEIKRRLELSTIQMYFSTVHVYVRRPAVCYVLCTDLSLLGDEDHPQYVEPPVIPGHEFFGEVVKLGKGLLQCLLFVVAEASYQNA